MSELLSIVLGLYDRPGHGPNSMNDSRENEAASVLWTFPRLLHQYLDHDMPGFSSDRIFRWVCEQKRVVGFGPRKWRSISLDRLFNLMKMPRNISLIARYRFCINHLCASNFQHFANISSGNPESSSIHFPTPLNLKPQPIWRTSRTLYLAKLSWCYLVFIHITSDQCCSEVPKPKASSLSFFIGTHRTDNTRRPCRTQDSSGPMGDQEGISTRSRWEASHDGLNSDQKLFAILPCIENPYTDVVPLQLAAQVGAWRSESSCGRRKKSPLLEIEARLNPIGKYLNKSKMEEFDTSWNIPYGVLFII